LISAAQCGQGHHQQQNHHIKLDFATRAFTRYGVKAIEITPRDIKLLGVFPAGQCARVCIGDQLCRSTWRGNRKPPDRPRPWFV
jgi:hypothetical protein